MRHTSKSELSWVERTSDVWSIAIFQCVQCESSYVFGLRARWDFDEQRVLLTKLGQMPSFGGRLPNNLRRFASDTRTSDLLLKGYRCLQQGYGVGAFAYLRLAVEELREPVFDLLLKVCDDDIQRQGLIEAKAQRSFVTALKEANRVAPGFLGTATHDPLRLLYSALSKGLHSGANDEVNLSAANAVLILLTDVLDRVREKRQHREKLDEAARLLGQLKDGG